MVGGALRMALRPCIATVAACPCRACMAATLPVSPIAIATASSTSLRGGRTDSRMGSGRAAPRARGGRAGWRGRGFLLVDDDDEHDHVEGELHEAAGRREGGASGVRPGRDPGSSLGWAQSGAPAPLPLLRRQPAVGLHRVQQRLRGDRIR